MTKLYVVQRAWGTPFCSERHLYWSDIGTASTPEGAERLISQHEVPWCLFRVRQHFSNTSEAPSANNNDSGNLHTADRGL